MGGYKKADPRGVPLTCSDRSDVGDIAADAVVVFQHEIPAIEAVFATVGNDVPIEPDAVFARRGEQETPSATIDAGDLGVGFQHRPSMARLSAAAS